MSILWTNNKTELESRTKHERFFYDQKANFAKLLLGVLLNQKSQMVILKISKR